VIEKEMVEPLSEDIVGSAEDYRRATRIASAYPFPTIEEVALTATRCAISNAAHQTADLVVLAGPVAERKVLLIRRAYPPFAGTYAIPGGHLDAGESPHQAAVRELQEETGIDVEGVDFVGLYTGASRDPRLSDSFVFVHQVGETIPEPRAGSDAAGVEWVSLENIAEGRVSLGFDHAQILRDTLASLDNGSPYLGRLEDIIAASDNRNADLLTEVDRMRGRGAIGAADIHLHEYDALKKESTAHIQSRNVFVWLNVVVLTAILCFFFLHENYTALLLAVPGLTLIFGWFYLVHNDKIAALSAYIGYGLAKRVGQEYFAFERSDKRGTQCSKTYNIAQVVVELLLFVVPAIVAPLGYLLWPQPPEVTLVSFSPVGIILVVVEILLALTLAVMLVLSSNLVRRWDVPRETWERL
jgi:8-oxo-dGTP diphosphatase